MPLLSPAATPLPEHGTYARYVSRRDPCRCRRCTDASAQYHRDYRNGVRRGRHSPPHQGRRHGTRSCYVAGCRLPECVQANRDYAREWQWLKRQDIPMIDITDVYRNGH